MDRSFLDPLVSKDGSPYGPKRYRELIKECWFISDNTHTSYTDVLDISYTEREQLILLIAEKQKATQAAVEDMKMQAANKNKGR